MSVSVWGKGTGYRFKVLFEVADDEERLRNQLSKAKAERNKKIYADVGRLGFEFKKREPSVARAMTMPGLKILRPSSRDSAFPLPLPFPV